MPQRLAIVTPVLDDWSSFAELVRRVAALPSFRDPILIDIFAVDDGSTEAAPIDAGLTSAKGCVSSIEILQLSLNLGHQRAIAIGLVEIVERGCHDAVVVMDCDGEDRPEDIAALIAAAKFNPQRIILAHRTKRSEPLPFQLGYALYKMLFRGLIGRRIGFGNFCLIPFAAARRLVHMPEAWNHLAAAVMRSRLGYDEIPSERGARYEGASHMSVTALVIHGLSAISVYTDVIFVRVLIVSTGLAVATILGILVVLATRFLTPLAIPGWATTAIGALLVILMQTVILVVVMTLVVLSSRSSSPIVPIMDSRKFVRSRQRLWPLSSP